jgi:hypothetical protein
VARRSSGNASADGQGKLDLWYPVRVPELLGPSYLREALCLCAARRRLVQIGQFLAELHRLAVFEAHGDALREEGTAEMLDGLTRHLSKQPGELTGHR